VKKGIFLAMLSISALAAAVAWSVYSAHAATASPNAGNVPAYTADRKLALPANYREWVFLSSGYGMNYSTGTGSHPMFTNVFVAPEAYQGFKSSGKWPDKSMFVVEIYSPTSQGSINKSGFYQKDFMGLDVEVKDASQKNEWSYYNFNPGDKTAEVIGSGACNSCHSEHAAVEHTFVQFYPTLLSFAEDKKLIKPGVGVR